MKPLKEIEEIPNLQVVKTGLDGGMGYVYLNGIKSKPAGVVWSNGMGWEHVSVSYPNRCPTRDEMCKVKDMFFNEEEIVVEYHPPKSEYVNIHPHCLHLWRSKNGEFKLPDRYMV